ncbi:hypothetical protein CSW62_13055 [Caulobacter sp. FWC2]|jgi:hypothetical protein|nr:hypothetical protein CSW62_13055 [Caulobacter sp. FWC2]
MPRRLTIDDMTPAARLAAAQTKASDLFSLIGFVIMCHENNRHLIYGRPLPTAVGTSKAANAFTVLQRQTFGFELIRLMSIWDSAKPDRTSIPTIWKLIDHPEVRAAMRKDIHDWWARPEGGERPSAFVDAKLVEHDHFLRRLERIVPAVLASRRLRALRAHRDAFIAHNLPMDNGAPTPRYGQESRLLATTEYIANYLGLVVNNTSAAYFAARAVSRDTADALWTNARFKI